MSSIIFKNITLGDINPYSTNPVYLTNIQKKCPGCSGPGRKKIFKGLWQYYKHQLYHHVQHPDDKIKIENEIREHAKKIIQGERK